MPEAIYTPPKPYVGAHESASKVEQRQMLAFMEDCLERAVKQAQERRSPAIDAVVCDFAIRVSELRAELAAGDLAVEPIYCGERLMGVAFVGTQEA